MFVGVQFFKLQKNVYKHCSSGSSTMTAIFLYPDGIYRPTHVSQGFSALIDDSIQLRIFSLLLLQRSF